MSKHTVRFIRSGVECDAEDGKTILRIARENGISLKSGCNHGVCNACICTVRKGFENILHKHHARERSFESPDCVQTCMATVTGDVSIEERLK